MTKAKTNKQSGASKFTSDHRDNPGLHLLYVKWAARFLTILDADIQKYWDMNNLTVHGVIQALQAERKHLVETDAAFAEADDILRYIKAGEGQPEVNKVESEHDTDLIIK